MSYNEPSIEVRIAEIAELDLTSLRAEWAVIHGRPAPMRLSRNLLARALAHSIQAKQWGGLLPATRRRLERMHSGDSQRDVPTSNFRLQPGSRLMREWNGETHVIDVLADGFEWNGGQYGSLSAVARAITGARWSGPRFFGLRNAARSPSRDEGAST
jgi:hypothetical protein